MKTRANQQRQYKAIADLPPLKILDHAAQWQGNQPPIEANQPATSTFKVISTFLMTIILSQNLRHTSMVKVPHSD